MTQEYFSAFSARVAIYKKWNEELTSFIVDKNFRKYEEAVAEATLSLRLIREAVQDTDFPEENKEIIALIEGLEDRHLRLLVQYHQNKVQNLPASNSEVQQIESEIMELIQELLPNNEL